jgi:hypothetical protein
MLCSLYGILDDGKVNPSNSKKRVIWNHEDNSSKVVECLISGFQYGIVEAFACLGS